MCCLLLSACIGGELGNFLAPEAPTTVTVADGAVKITGPDGYCIDEQATRDGADAAIVLLASCAALTREAGKPQPRVPAIVMASVSAEGTSMPIADLARFMETETGRAALSRTGSADDIEILEIEETDRALYIHAQDSLSALTESLREDYWRALFALDDRLVSISILNPRTRPLEPEQARALLDRFMTRIREANSIESSEA